MNSGKWLLAALCTAMIALGGITMAQAAEESPIYAKQKNTTGTYKPQDLSKSQLKDMTEMDFGKRMAMVKAQNAINSDRAAEERKQIVADKVQRMMNERQQYLQEQQAAALAAARGANPVARSTSKATPVYNTPARKKSGEPFKIFNFGKKN